ncbi:hypothetical protein [Synechococcus sp. BS56D]|uniref:hypothetical protein n=1 Tax=Synechococcus sp. BS56D TaxID=2055944 RepID=UPI00103998B6|nr:hypothetical protein [Synechococcus sp. BS56D]
MSFLIIFLLKPLLIFVYPQYPSLYRALQFYIPASCIAIPFVWTTPLLLKLDLLKLNLISSLIALIVYSISIVLLSLSFGLYGALITFSLVEVAGTLYILTSPELHARLSFS